MKIYNNTAGDFQPSVAVAVLSSYGNGFPPHGSRAEDLSLRARDGPTLRGNLNSYSDREKSRHAASG